MVVNSREAAVTALYRTENEGAYLSHALLDAVSKLSTVDKAFVTDLVMGVERNKLWIDFIIRKHSKIRIKKISPWVLQILRTGVYQLLMMDKIPASAACNEAVKLASKYAHSAAKNYVNGVMRAIARSVENLPEADGTESEKLSVRYSCPLWLTEKLIEQFGTEKCIEILKDSLVPHPTTVRVKTLKTSAKELEGILNGEGIKAVANGEVEQCLEIKGALNISMSNAYKSGLYTLQNINSMRAVLALEPKRGETIVDVCSAPGGKTTFIAELIGNDGKVYAFDIYEHKIELIKNTAKRLGISCIEPMVHNSEEVKKELVGIADRVLADVPCSGIGVIHKKPDIKWNRCADDIRELTRIQKNILDSSARYVKSGGALVYSTCTILAEENEMQTDRFVKEHDDFIKDYEKLYLADETGGSGFYICRFIRK